MKTTIAERLKALIIALGENQNSFSVSIGYRAPTTAKILNGQNNPGFEYLQSILTKYKKVNARWLITGEGKMFDKG